MDKIRTHFSVYIPNIPFALDDPYPERNCHHELRHFTSTPFLFSFCCTRSIQCLAFLPSHSRSHCFCLLTGVCFVNPACSIQVKGNSSLPEVGLQSFALPCKFDSLFQIVPVQQPFLTALRETVPLCMQTSPERAIRHFVFQNA